MTAIAPSALEKLTALVRTEMTAQGVSPADRPSLERIVTSSVDGYQRLAAMGQETGLADPVATAEKIVAAVAGLGPFEALLAPRGRIEDVFIEGERVTYFDGRLRALAEPVTEDESRHVVDQLLASTDATLDRAHPVVDGVQVLGGRARLAAAIPPASDHLSVAIRLYVQRNASLTGLIDNDTLSPAAAALLALDVRAKGSVLISGETGSGKSTLLAALLDQAHPNHNVRLIEESQELMFRPVHGGRLQVVPGGLSGARTGADSLRDLIKLSLRMKPDVIAVGEVRGADAWDLSRASAVGAGFLSTIHAADAEDALEALVLLALMAGENISEKLVRRAFARSIHLVVHCEREDPNQLSEGESNLHQVTEIRAVSPLLSDDAFSSEVVFARPKGLGSPLEYTGKQPPTRLVRRLSRLLPAGVTFQDVLTGKHGVR